MKILKIKVSGKVQGVHFRESTKGVADLLKIKGWIRNHSEGHVLMEVGGDPIALEEFLNWCHEGPDRAKVENVIVEELAISDISQIPGLKNPFLNFEILR